MYDFYYFNGDSYSASSPTIPMTWVDSFAQKNNLSYLNQAKIGSSNARIIRSTLESLHKIKNSYKKIMVVIGFSFISRDEIWDIESNSLVTLDKILAKKKVPDELKLKLHYQDINHQVIHFYTNLFMFVNLLEKWNIDYFIFSGADNTDFGTLNWDYLQSLAIYNEIQNNPRIYKFHDFCVKKWANDHSIKTSNTGHLIDNEGIGLFAEKIDKEINNLVK